MGSGEKQSKALPLVYNAYNNTQNIFGLKIIHCVNAYIFTRVISIQGSHDKFFFKKCLMIKMGPNVSFSLTNFRKVSLDYRPLTSYFLGAVTLETLELWIFLFLWSINLLQFRNVFLRDLESFLWNVIIKKNITSVA